MPSRLITSVHEAMAAQNKFLGSGGGGGMLAVLNLGISDVGGAAFSSTTFAVVSGSPISICVGQTTDLLALFLTTGKLTAGANNGLIRCNLVGLGTSGNMYFGAPYDLTLMGWRFYPGVARGQYTIQLEGAVDVAGSTLTTLESALQVFQLGA